MGKEIEEKERKEKGKERKEKELEFLGQEEFGQQYKPIITPDYLVDAPIVEKETGFLESEKTIFNEPLDEKDSIPSDEQIEEALKRLTPKQREDDSTVTAMERSIISNPELVAKFTSEFEQLYPNAQTIRSMG